VKTRDLAYIALFAALTAVLGLLPAILVPAVPVPITAQTLGVMLAGAVLGAPRVPGPFSVPGALRPRTRAHAPVVPGCGSRTSD
jgi:biotin transporter BioY